MMPMLFLDCRSYCSVSYTPCVFLFDPLKDEGEIQSEQLVPAIDDVSYVATIKVHDLSASLGKR